MPGFAPALPTAERQAIAAEWQRLADAPPPRERRVIGLAVSIVAIVLFFAGPFVLRGLGIELPRGTTIALGIALMLACFGGVFFGVLLVSSRYSQARMQAESAVAWLAENGAGGDPSEKRRQAVTLLFHAFCTDGPSTTNTIDFEQTREHLRDALPYVMSVERALRTDQNIYPVFTGSKVRLPG